MREFLAGYDSVHGVASSAHADSDFNDDEFVVYDARQQAMRYLVEFTAGMGRCVLRCL